MTEREIEWAQAYDGYARLASTADELGRLIAPARNSFRRHGQMPDWCGVDFLRGWAFLLTQDDQVADGSPAGDEWRAVLQALRNHPAAKAVDKPPVRPREVALTAGSLPTEFSGKPKMHRDPEFLARKQARLWESHVAPINSFVDGIRAERGQHVPYVDPDSGGTLAQVLFVLESPAAPAAHGSGMLSADNNDGTAANVWTAYRESGLPRTHGLHWNATPWYIGDGGLEKNVSSAQVEAGHRYLLDLLELVPHLRVVVAMGRPAQYSLLRIEPALQARGVTLLHSLHPSPRNNPRGGAKAVQAVFQEAFDLVKEAKGK